MLNSTVGQPSLPWNLTKLEWIALLTATGIVAAVLLVAVIVQSYFVRRQIRRHSSKHQGTYEVSVRQDTSPYFAYETTQNPYSIEELPYELSTTPSGALSNKTKRSSGVVVPLGSTASATEIKDWSVSLNQRKTEENKVDERKESPVASKLSNYNQQNKAQAQGADNVTITSAQNSSATNTQEKSQVTTKTRAIPVGDDMDNRTSASTMSRDVKRRRSGVIVVMDSTTENNANGSNEKSKDRARKGKKRKKAQKTKNKRNQQQDQPTSTARDGHLPPVGQSQHSDEVVSTDRKVEFQLTRDGRSQQSELSTKNVFPESERPHFSHSQPHVSDARKVGRENRDSAEQLHLAVLKRLEEDVQGTGAVDQKHEHHLTYYNSVVVEGDIYEQIQPSD